MLLLLIVVVSALLVGYVWGKHDKVIHQTKQLEVSIPILLRQQSLERGYCLLCNGSKKNKLRRKLRNQYKMKLVCLRVSNKKRNF
ncbi:hypothetical protein UFO1_2152 [Pelosinus sp. UFO1]|nr:hypothetical protein UFO1_2152 [Pelosinus sp. UFO1]